MRRAMTPAPPPAALCVNATVSSPSTQAEYFDETSLRRDGHASPLCLTKCHTCHMDQQNVLPRFPDSPTDLSQLRADPVSIHVAPWFFGGVPDDMSTFVAWDLTRTGDAYMGRTIESVNGTKPNLVRTSRLGLAADLSDPRGYDRVAERLRYHDDITQNRGSWELARQLQKGISERYPKEVAHALAIFRVLVSGAEAASDLPMVITSATEGLRASNFHHAALFLVESTDRLSRRYGVARAMLHTGDHAPEPDAKEVDFSSSIRLMEDVNVGLSAYLEPLVTSLSPHIWATTAPRPGGVIVFIFGIAISAKPILDLDLLALSERPAGVKAFMGLDAIPPTAYPAALRWWTKQLDIVFSHLTQPANYVLDGQYHAPSAVERMLAFEQLCRSVQVIGSSRDGHARRLALFHTLDSLGGLNKTLTRDRATTLSKMQAVLADLETRLPFDIQAVLLPRAHAAVAALQDVQNGFFMVSRIRGNEILLPDKHGGESLVPLATAAREWLTVLRNSQHGMDKAPTPRTRALLSAHTGDLSPRIADLAWLSLLEILARPDLLVRAPRASH